jgi:hypothetical protein
MAAAGVAVVPTTAVAGGQSVVVWATSQPPQSAAGATTAPVQLVLPWHPRLPNFALMRSRMLTRPWQLLPWQLAATVEPVQLLTGNAATTVPVQLAGAVATTLAPWQLPWHEPRSRPKEAVSPSCTSSTPDSGTTDQNDNGRITCCETFSQQPRKRSFTSLCSIWAGWVRFHCSTSDVAISRCGIVHRQ